jgi:hypothetical protein
MKLQVTQCIEARIQLIMATERLRMIEAGDFSERQFNAVRNNLRDALLHLGFELAPLVGQGDGGRL